MASAPRPSSQPRQTWRERSRPLDQTPTARRIRRWFLSLLLILLVGLFVWLLWLNVFPGEVHLAYWSVPEYGLHAPPMPFGNNDAAAFAEAGISVVKSTQFHFEQIGKQTQTSSFFTELNRVVTDSNDTLILYLSAHGVSSDGKGYLLCSDFGIGTDTGRVEISVFLKQLKDCKAGKKLIILDAGHLPTAPHMGCIVNEFPVLLQNAVADTHDERLWVLTANRLHESSHVSNASRRSVFNYFVVNGIAGQADTVRPDGNVDLAELVSFVGSGVSDWVRRQYGNTDLQTPLLSWGAGRVNPESLESIFVARGIRLPREQDDKAPIEGAATLGTPGVVIHTRGNPVGLFAVDAAKLYGPATLALFGVPASDPAKAANEPKGQKAPISEGQAASEAPASSNQSKAVKAEPAEADAKSAAPSKSANPEGVTTDGKQPSDASPHNQDVAPDKSPPTESVKPSVEGPLSAVESLWQERDDLARGRDQSWRPVDYAPRKWREFQDAILSYEWRIRESLSGSEAPKLVWKEKEKLDSALRALEASEGGSLLSQAVDEYWIGPLLRDRNDHIDHAVNLVAWHAQAARGAKSKNRFEDIDRFLSALIELQVSLEKAVDEDFSDDSNVNNRLEKARDRCSEIWRDVVDKLAGDAREAVRYPERPGAARKIEDLLGTALPIRSKSSPTRIELLEVLAGLGKLVPLKSTLNEQTTDLKRWLNSGVDELPDSSEAWERALDHAQLEAQLVGLAEPEGAGRLLKQVDDARRGKPIGRVRCVRDVSKELEKLYRSLPKMIDDSIRDKRLHRADAQLRLLAASDLSQLARIDSIPALTWKRPQARGLAFDGIASEVPLSSAGPAELEGSLRSTGGLSGPVKIAVRYNPRTLRVESADQSLPVANGEPSERRRIEPNLPIKLSYRIEPRVRQQSDLDFTIVAIDEENKRKYEWPIRCIVPPPDDIKLVVAPSDGVVNEKLVSEPQGRRQAVSTFPGHVTSFRFQLQQETNRPRKVNVELRGVSAEREDAIGELRRKLRRLAADDASGLVNADVPTVLLGSNEMEIPGGTELIPIKFEAFPKRPPPPAPGAPPTAASNSTEPVKPSINCGLILVVTEPEHADLGPWVTWIDLSPWAPKDYIKSALEFEDGELRAKLKLLDTARPQGGDPVEAKWEVLPKDVQGSQVISSAKLWAKNKFEGRLSGRFGRHADKALDVLVEIDGYPRAFVYRIPLNADRRNVPPEKTLTEIEIEPKETILKVEGSATELPVKVRVSAPEDAFGFDREDRVRVGLDVDRNETIGEVLWTAFGDRQITLRLDRIDPDGRVAIRTDVSDFDTVLECRDMDGRYNLVAEVVVDSFRTAAKPVQVVFDKRRPRVTRIAPENDKWTVAVGESIKLHGFADDGDGSGVSVVKCAIDEDGDLKLGDEEKKAAEKNVAFASANGAFALDWEAKKEHKGVRTMLVWATDKVGWESAPEPVEIDVIEKPSPKPAAIGKAAAEPKGIIQGEVTYGGPIPNVTVTLLQGDSKKATKTTDANGKFEFKNLAPGDYRLEAAGTAKNSKRKGGTTATVPSPPKGPVIANIKLEL